MTPRSDIPICQWLAAEADGRDADAELALAGVFQALPLNAPSPGFADRVLIATGWVAPSWTHPSWTESRWARGAIAASLLVVGLALFWTLPVLLGLTRLVTPGELVSLGARAFVATVGQIDELLTLWQIWTRIAATVHQVVTSPPVVAAFLALTALSAFTLRGLSELLSPDRSLEYV